MVPFQAMALDVTLQWDPNTQPDLAGYKIYYDTDSGDPYEGTGATEGGSPIDMPLDQDENPDPDIVEFTVSYLEDGITYYLAVTAYDDQDRESDYSNEVNTNDEGGVAQNIKLAMTSSPQVLLCAWENEVGKTPEGYNIYISSTHNGADAPIGSINGDISEFYVDAADNSFCSAIDWDIYDSVHIAIVTVTGGLETASVVAYYLYGNIIGTYNDGTPCGSARIDGFDYAEWGTQKYLTATHPEPNCGLPFTFTSDTTTELSDVDGSGAVNNADRYLLRMVLWGNTAN